VRLFVSALLLAAVPAAFAQQNTGQTTITPQSGPQQQATLASAVAQAEAVGRNQTGCPLYMESASVAPNAGYLPVTAQQRQDGALNLHFRNQSGKAIAAASITARVNVKTNVYDLDAHPLEMRLTLSGTESLDTTLDQIQHIVLPKHVYLFGVARVTLDQVTFADGSLWTAQPRNNTCRTSGAGIDQIVK
jgi:uncharacterized protein GlcG (DUF336 family)